MSQSTSPANPACRLHVAIIMDGSGRWARARGWPRSAGHRAGIQAVRRVVEAAPGLGIGALSLHAFSSDNWHRPLAEVAMLFRIFDDYLRKEIAHWTAEDVRVTVFGRRDRVPEFLREAMEAAEAATGACRQLHLRLAIDYSARESIVRAAERLNLCENASEQAFSRLMAEAMGDADVPEVDFLIRTGGEQRLSDFFLWECAYAELFFTRALWPDFGAQDLAAAIQDFRSRERRFGRVPMSVAV